MGISHPLSDEYDALRGAVLSPETTPPSSPLAHRHLLEHEVTRMDTLAGIAIKYGVEISDIKRANSLVTDSQMFTHKTLIIPPLPGMAMPSSVDLNASGQRTKRTWAPNHGHGQKRGAQPKSCQQGASPAMNTLQRYYGLTPPQKGGNTNPHRSTELSVYDKGETLLNPSAAPGTDRSWNFEAPAKEIGFSATKAAKGDVGAPRPEQDGSMRQRQKVEAESNAQGDFLVKAIKRMLISSIRLDTDAGSPDSSQKSGISFLGGFKSMTVRKSPSAPSFEHGASMMWSSSKWTFSHDSFTRPLLDGLPKPASARRTKTALD